MKLSVIVGSRQLLEDMAQMEMDGVGSLEFAEFLRIAFSAIQAFETKRAELFRKYGEEVGEGEERRLQILPENEKKFNSAIKRGLNKEINVEAVNMSSLGVKISPAKLVNAEGLFV